MKTTSAKLQHLLILFDVTQILIELFRELNIFYNDLSWYVHCLDNFYNDIYCLAINPSVSSILSFLQVSSKPSRFVGHCTTNA